MAKTQGVNIYLGTSEEKEQALRNADAIAKALGFDSRGQVVKWLFTMNTSKAIAALQPLREEEINAQLNEIRKSK